MAADRYILLVEDNPNEETLTLHALRENGITNAVVVARDGVEALDFLFGEDSRRRPESARLPAVIVMDLKLPRIDGFELMRRIRAHERSSLIPLVILTASHDPNDIREAYRLGANSYVLKPVELDRFVMVIGLLARYWLNLNQTTHTDSGY